MSSAGPGTVFNTTHAGGNAQITNVNGDFVQNVYTMSPEQEHRIYQWLDAPDSSSNFLAAREKHHEQTGSWFIEGEEYLRWKETPDSALWVYGTPGCGKTIICSTVIDKICEECAATPTSACAYFFFDSRNAQTDLSLHDRLIRSIIKQLSHQSAGFPAPLAELYSGGRQPSLKALQLTLDKIIDGFGHTYIIIDAVDECADREKVLAWIEQLTHRKTGNLQVLFSSRPERDITDQLQSMVSLYRVTLNGKLADKDIETYLDAMLSKLTRWDKETIARVRSALLTGSDGMFRWVALQISELFKCRTRKAVDDQLRNLPKDLEGMYETSLLKSPHPQDLKRFLMWLAFSSRPLEPKELTDVVTVDFSSNDLPSYDPDLRYFGPADMLITCSSFVTETEGRNNYSKPIRVIKLAHMSIKDYLVSERLKNGPASYFSISAILAHSLITKTCLAYIFHLRSLHSTNHSILKSFPLGTYAAQYLTNHMRLGGGEDEHVSQMMACLFSLDGRALASWVRLYNPDTPTWYVRPKNHRRPSAIIAAPLYYACVHGIQRVAQQLLIAGAPVNAEGGFYGNALQAASSGGHNDIVRLLLDQGADASAQGGDYGNALQAASFGGHDDIVSLLLLEHGTDVNAQGGRYGNALQAASDGGHDDIVRLLLEQGADVNAQGRYHGNALQAASELGHIIVVRLLLEQGAEVNVQGGTHGNALQAASYGGHDATVRLLLETGAAVNAQGGYHGNALQAASGFGHIIIVRLLLEKGAEVNAQGGMHGSALQAASGWGHIAIVRLLLGQGAEVNAQGGCFGPALQAASRGHDDIVRLLLEQGADMKVQGGPCENALQAASESGNNATVRLLLEKGAEVNAQGGKYGNALQAASRRGYNDTVGLLLEKGAYVNAQGGRYGNALQAASYGGYGTTVRLLLEQGADVSAQGGCFGSALKAARCGHHIAAREHKGRKLTVKLLLEHGAIDEDSEDHENYGDEYDDSADDSEDHESSSGSYEDSADDSEDYEDCSGEDEDGEEQDDEVDGSVETGGDERSTHSGSEDEWAAPREAASIGEVSPLPMRLDSPDALSAFAQPELTDELPSPQRTLAQDDPVTLAQISLTKPSAVGFSTLFLRLPSPAPATRTLKRPAEDHDIGDDASATLLPHKKPRGMSKSGSAASSSSSPGPSTRRTRSAISAHQAAVAIAGGAPPSGDALDAPRVGEHEDDGTDD